MRYTKNQKGSTLLISMIILTFSMSLAGHITTEIVQFNQRHQVVLQTKGMYDFGVQLAHLFVYTQQEKDMDELMNQLPEAIIVQDEEVKQLIAHANQYLLEVERFYTWDGFQNACAIQQYQYSVDNDKITYIENTIYVNDSKSNLKPTDYNFRKVNHKALELLTNYDIVQDKYQGLVKRMIEGESIKSIDADFILLKDEMNKRYQFLLFTYVYQPILDESLNLKIEQPIISLLSYTINNENNLIYDFINLYTLKNTGGAI